VVQVPRVLRDCETAVRRFAQDYVFLGHLTATTSPICFRAQTFLVTGNFRVTRNSELYIDEETRQFAQGG